MNAKAVLTAAAGKVAAGLKARGFERRGLTFVRRAVDGFVSMIELQPSRKSTPEQLLFVVNFGVIVPSLFAGDALAKPEYGGCHWGGRVSGKDGVEIWWPVRADDDVEQVAARVTVLMEEEVLPVLEAKQREEDLIALWKTGRSPLLVDSQRLLFLGSLLHRAGRRAEFEQTKAELERKATDSFSLRALGKLKELDG
jgi:Domain of unknown function (DUF4304)